MAGKRRPVAAQARERQHPRKAGAAPTRELPALGNLAKRIRQKWRSSRDELPLERLEAELGDSRRYDIVAALKELEKAGLGEFSVGQKGHRASFVWTKGKPPVAQSASKAPVAVSMPPVAKTVTKAPIAKTVRAPAPERHASVEWERAPKRLSHRDRAETAPSSGSALLPHTFHVRPEVVVSFDLPEDVTRTEIERLCAFLQAIPFR